MVGIGYVIRHSLKARYTARALGAQVVPLASFLFVVAAPLLFFGAPPYLVAVLVALNFLIALPIAAAIRVLFPGGTLFEVTFFAVAATQVTVAVAGFLPLGRDARTLTAILFGVSCYVMILVFTDVSEREVPQASTKNLTLPVAIAATLGLAVWLLVSSGDGRPGVSSSLSQELEVARSDIPFFELLSAGIARHGISESGIVFGESLRYHVLSYSWLGSINETVDAPTFLVQSVVGPVFFAGLLSLGVAAWAFRLSNSTLTAVLAGLLVLVANSVVIPTFGGMGGSVVRPFSLSTSFSAPIVLGTAWAVLSTFRRQDKWVYLASFAGVFIATAGKTSSVVLVLIPVGLVLYAARERADLGRALVTFASAVVAAAAAFALFAYGQNESGLLRPFDLGVFALGIGESAAYVGFVMVSTFAYFPRWSGILGGYPVHLRLVGFVAASLLLGTLGLTGLIDPTVNNRGWFPVSAAPVLGVFAAVGLGWGLSRLARSINWFLLLSLSVGGIFLWTYASDSVWIRQRPGAFPILIVATSLALAFMSIRWDRVEEGVRPRARVIGTVAAAPLTIASLLAVWLFPVASSPELSVSSRQLLDEEWKSSLQLADRIRDQVDPNQIVLSDSEFDLWAPVLLGANSYISGKNYWGLGSASLEETALDRERERDLWMQEPDLPLDDLCSRGISIVWTTGERQVQWTNPSYTEGQIRVWLIDCNVI